MCCVVARTTPWAGVPPPYPWAYAGTARRRARTARKRRGIGAQARRTLGYRPARAALNRHRLGRAVARGRPHRLVGQRRGQPPLDLLDGHPLPPRVVIDLVAAERADVEVRRLGVGEVEAADGGRRRHREVLGEGGARVGLGVEEAEERDLLGVIGLGRVAGGRADAAVALADEVVVREVLLRRVAPELPADALVEPL